MPSVRSIAALVLVVLAATGCSKRSYRSLPDVPKGGDDKARARFVEARQKFENDEQAPRPELVGEFEAIARENESDPVAPFALLFAGMSATRSGDYDRALASFDALLARQDAEATVRRRAHLYRGFALVYAGRPEDALDALEQGREAVSDDDEQVEWLLCSAEASASRGDAKAAILFYDRAYEDSREGERAYILDRIRTLGGGVRDAELGPLLRQVEGEGPAMAVLGIRSSSYRERANDARESLGLAVAVESSGSANPRLVGALLPLSGRRARVGSVALRGLELANSSYAESAGRGIGIDGRPRAFTLDVADSESTAAAAARAVTELERSGVVGVVGPVDARSVEAAGDIAQRSGLPLLTLDPRAESGESFGTVFHMMHSAESRARSLARHAIDQGVRDFAIFAPSSGYGRAVGAAFAAEVRRLRGQVVVDAVYDDKTTSFGDPIKQLRKPWQALFIPDLSRRVELIAPALASANFVAQPLGAKKPKHGRGFLLLSTAEALSESFLQNAGRYTSGAVFAPGFYADRRDPEIRRFVDDFEQIHRSTPIALDAYAYDAAYALRAAIEDGASNRGGVLHYLSSESVEGVTGRIGFDGARRRRDNGVLFRVTTDDEGALAIRAIR